LVYLAPESVGIVHDTTLKYYSGMEQFGQLAGLITLRSQVRILFPQLTENQLIMEILTDEIIIEKLNEDGFMEEPDGPWLLDYIQSEYGGNLDNTSDFIDDKWTLKIYSEMTYDGYDIFWCTFEDKPYVSQDGYYYEDYSEWSEKAVEELTSGSNVWVDPCLWSDMEYDFNYELENWWPEVYEELFDQKREELLDTGEYKLEEE
tara:strand:+ start:36 stop:647 length:612 start_codon:yes stop_codon:yes gene_type:complete